MDSTHGSYRSDHSKQVTEGRARKLGREHKVAAWGRTLVSGRSYRLWNPVEKEIDIWYRGIFWWELSFLFYFAKILRIFLSVSCARNCSNPRSLSNIWFVMNAVLHSHMRFVVGFVSNLRTLRGSWLKFPKRRISTSATLGQSKHHASASKSKILVRIQYLWRRGFGRRKIETLETGFFLLLQRLICYAGPLFSSSSLSQIFPLRLFGIGGISIEPRALYFESLYISPFFLLRLCPSINACKKK